MIPVVIESPYSGDIPSNLEYLDRCIRDTFSRGEAAFASHQMYTRVLEDRKVGIEAGYAWWDHAHRIVFYIDLGWSEGMRAALARAVATGKPFETRSIPNAHR